MTKILRERGTYTAWFGQKVIMGLQRMPKVRLRMKPAVEKDSAGTSERTVCHGQKNRKAAMTHEPGGK